MWLVGQAVKTPPSHGGNRGSIPLRAVAIKNSPTQQKALKLQRFNAFYFFKTLRTECQIDFLFTPYV